MLGIQKTAELSVDDHALDNDVPSSGRRWFKALCNAETIKQYATYVAQYLWLLIQLLNEEERARCDLAMPEALINAVRALPNSVDENGDAFSIHSIHQVAITLLNLKHGALDTYNHVPICYLSLAQFVNTAGDLARVDAAQKSTSAIKFWLRGSLLLSLAESESSANFVQTRQLIAYEIGGCHPFAQLARLHKGICSIPRVIKASVVVGDGDVETGSLTVDGLDLSFHPKLKT
jgi:hypothetical protein